MTTHDAQRSLVEASRLALGDNLAGRLNRGSGPQRRHSRSACRSAAVEYECANTRASPRRCKPVTLPLTRCGLDDFLNRAEASREIIEDELLSKAPACIEHRSTPDARSSPSARPRATARPRPITLLLLPIRPKCLRQQQRAERRSRLQLRCLTLDARPRQVVLRQQVVLGQQVELGKQVVFHPLRFSLSRYPSRSLAQPARPREAAAPKPCVLCHHGLSCPCRGLDKVVPGKKGVLHVCPCVLYSITLFVSRGSPSTSSSSPPPRCCPSREQASH